MWKISDRNRINDWYKVFEKNLKKSQYEYKINFNEKRQ